MTLRPRRVPPRATWLSRAVDRLQARFMALGWLAQGVCWIGSNWWRLGDLRRVAWACRAQLLSVAIGGGLIALTDQARDIVIASAAGKEGLGNKLGLVGTMLFWASVSWYCRPKGWTCLVDRTHPGAPDICGIYK